MNTAALATATVAAHFVLTLTNALRLRTLRGETVKVAAGEVVKYATLADGSIGIRLADGRGLKVTVEEWRHALASGESVDGYQEAAYVLRVKSNKPNGQRNRVYARLTALGYTKTCGRCGGGGHFSRCQQYGTICFDCGGKGVVTLRITCDLLADAENRVNAGELDGYLVKIAAKAAALRAVKPLIATITQEWKSEEGTGVHASYRAAYRGNLLFPGCAESHAAGLVNDIWDAAKETERAVEYSNLDATVAVERLNECLAMLRAVNAAWAAYEGDNRLTK